MSKKPPNVVFFFTDTQRHDSTGLGGNPLGLTPHFDHLAQRGTYFANAFSPQPVCTPCRACLQTGVYPTDPRNGVYRNAIPIQADARTIAHHFNDAGYETAYIGKWHLSDESRGEHALGPVPRELRGGWRRWRGTNCIELDCGAYDAKVYDEKNQPVALPGYRSDALIDEAVRYLREPKKQPFFMFLSLLEPHIQNTEGAYVAPDRTRGRYTGAWTPPDLAALPVVERPGTVSGEHPHVALADYWAMCERIDQGLGRLTDALRSLGLEDDTIVVFTSDHGCHFNTRNHHVKSSGHEASIHVPLGIWGGPFRGGGYREEVVSLIDLPPTLLEACGVGVPEHFHGRSLLPLIARSTDDWPDEAFVQVSQSGVTRALRTRRWKYIVDAPDADGWSDPTASVYVERELYDLEHDPYELRNLAGLGSHRAVADGLKARLLRRMAAAHEPAAEIGNAQPLDSGQRMISGFQPGE